MTEEMTAIVSGVLMVLSNQKSTTKLSNIPEYRTAGNAYAR